MQEDEIKEIAERLKKLASLAIDIVNTLPTEYKKDAFIETYRYLLTFYGSRGIGVVSSHAGRKLETSTPAVVPELSQTLGDIKASKDKEETSLSDFVNMLSNEPKSNAEWITVFAYYMKHYENKKKFSTKEVKDYFRAVGLKVPANLSRDFNNAVNKKGYIARDIESNNYYITRKGEELVRGMLSGKEQKQYN
ncbi:MAG: hypothetical protein GSR84_02750 [Desulfurococcales archaeon]|nr:hypothetical protein [Desulfurococcales archaeon]